MLLITLLCHFISGRGPGQNSCENRVSYIFNTLDIRSSIELLTIHIGIFVY